MIASLTTLPTDFVSSLQESLADRCHLEGVVGRGKNGVALTVKMANNLETYCLKAPVPTAFDTEEMERIGNKLAQEVAILSKLDHRCLPRIIFSDLKAKIPFYICTYHRGVTCFEFIKRSNFLSIEKSIFVIHSLIDVFEYLHDAGRTHCDAHEDNILISENVFKDGIMVIDFGSGHRRSDDDPFTFAGGALAFKGTGAQKAHIQTVTRSQHEGDFEAMDRRAVGRLFGIMQNVLFSDASIRQKEEYTAFSSDMQAVK